MNEIQRPKSDVLSFYDSPLQRAVEKDEGGGEKKKENLLKSLISSRLEKKKTKDDRHGRSVEIHRSINRSIDRSIVRDRVHFSQSRGSLMVSTWAWFRVAVHSSLLPPPPYEWLPTNNECMHQHIYKRNIHICKTGGFLFRFLMFSSTVVSVSHHRLPARTVCPRKTGVVGYLRLWFGSRRSFRRDTSLYISIYHYFIILCPRAPPTSLDIVRRANSPNHGTYLGR